MIRAAVLALVLLAGPALAQGVQPTVVGEITKLRQQAAALEGRIADLEQRLVQAEAKGATNRSDIVNLITSHNVNVQYFLIRACDYNRRVEGWRGVLTGLEPIPLTGLDCPPEGTRFYVPYFHGAAPVPPAP